MYSLGVSVLIACELVLQPDFTPCLLVKAMFCSSKHPNYSYFYPGRRKSPVNPLGHCAQFRASETWSGCPLSSTARMGGSCAASSVAPPPSAPPPLWPLWSSPTAWCGPSRYGRPLGQSCQQSQLQASSSKRKWSLEVGSSLNCVMGLVIGLGGSGDCV